MVGSWCHGNIRVGNWPCGCFIESYKIKLDK